jgi:hypothetical protein
MNVLSKNFFQSLFKLHIIYKHYTHTPKHELAHAVKRERVRERERERVRETDRQTDLKLTENNIIKMLQI